MKLNWSKLASLAQKTCTLNSFQFSLVYSVLPKDNPFVEHSKQSSCFTKQDAPHEIEEGTDRWTWWQDCATMDLLSPGPSCS